MTIRATAFGRSVFALFALVALTAKPLLAVSGKHGKLIVQDPFRTGKSACGVCHSTHGGKGFRMWVVPPAAQTATGKDLCGSSALCYSCHDGTVTTRGAALFDYTETGMAMQGKKKTSHPVNVPMKPGMRRPPWATLFTGTVGANTYTDVLTCGTCHDPHNDSRYPYYLKSDPTGGRICVECHADK